MGWDLGEGLGLRSIIMLSVGVGVLVFVCRLVIWSWGGLGSVSFRLPFFTCVTLVALGGLVVGTRRVGW